MKVKSETANPIQDDYKTSTGQVQDSASGNEAVSNIDWNTGGELLDKRWNHPISFVEWQVLGKDFIRKARKQYGKSEF